MSLQLNEEEVQQLRTLHTFPPFQLLCRLMLLEESQIIARLLESDTNDLTTVRATIKARRDLMGWVTRAVAQAAVEEKVEPESYLHRVFKNVVSFPLPHKGTN
jgi:hypothetical protein